MSTKTFVGNTIARPQITSWIFEGIWEATDVLNITINGKTVSTTAGSTDKADILTALVAFLVSQTDPDFAAINWTTTDDEFLVAESVYAGVPFVCTVATTETGGGAADDQEINSTDSSTGTVVQTANGPTFLSVASALDTGTILANGDDFVCSAGGDILYGLNQSAVTLASIDIRASYTASIGLTAFGFSNLPGFGTRYEIGQRFLSIKATEVDIGLGDGDGSRQINLDLLDAETHIRVHKTAVPTASEAAVTLLATHAANTLEVTGGRVAVAPDAGQVSTFTTVRMDQRATPTDSQLMIGEDVTLGTVTIGGGTFKTLSGCTTLEVLGGIVYLSGESAFTTIRVSGGVVYYRSSGDIATELIVSGTGKIYFDKGSSRSVPLITFQGGGEVFDLAKTLALPVVINRVGCNEQGGIFHGPIDMEYSIDDI